MSRGRRYGSKVGARSASSGAAVSGRGYVEQATIKRKFFPKPGQPEHERGWTIALAIDYDTGQEVKLVGTFGPVYEEQMIAIKNDYSKPPPWVMGEFDWEYKVKSLNHSDPVTREALLSYLRHLPGVGDQLAQAILDTFSGAGPFDGQAILMKIDADPAVLQQVQGRFGHHIQGELDTLIAKWSELRDERREMLFFSTLGFKDSLSKQIRSHFDEQNIDPVAAVKQNPYILVEVDDIGFKLADAAAHSLGVAFDDPRRLIAGLDFVLDRAKESDSHICLPRAALLRKAPAILAYGGHRPLPAELEKALQEALHRGQLISYTDSTDGVERIYTRQMYIVETRLYEKLNAFLTHERLEPPEGFSLTKPEGSVVTDEQWQAVRNSFQEKVSILTGGPGTGKTTSLRSLLDTLESQGQTYICMAPTGKAAKRMSESTGRPAMTIHLGMLHEGYSGLIPPKSVEEQVPESQCFKQNVIIIDEASMLDAELAERLISHMGPETRLVLVGDPDQLPPVGVGAVLDDLLSADRVPTTRLTKIFRQAEGSLLVVNAHRIKDGLEPFWTTEEAEKALGHPVLEDFRVIEAGTVLGVRDETLDQVQGIATKLGIDPSEVLVTAPFRKGEAGVNALNCVLQDIYNPGGEEVRGGTTEPLRVGDLVMNTKNRYAKREEGYEYDVMNGDTGVIVSWNPDKKRAEIDFGNGVMRFSGESLDKVVPAYAATIHKLQGSQGPGVAMPLSQSPIFHLVTRNHVYTAMTRAEEECVIIVDSKATLRSVLGRSVTRETTLDLRVGRIEPRLKAAWEVIKEYDELWAEYRRTRNFPQRLRPSLLAS